MTVDLNNNKKQNNFVNTQYDEESSSEVKQSHNTNTQQPNNTSKKSVSLSAPWVVYYKKVAELLYGDEEVEVSELDESKGDIKSFTIATDNFVKLMSLKKILKNDIEFGNIILHINFMDASDKEVTAKDWEAAFKGNEYFVGISGPDPKRSTPEGYQYALFTRDIIDFYKDDLTDCYGYDHVLPADIARQIVTGTIYPCTVMDFEDEEEK